MEDEKLPLHQYEEKANTIDALKIAQVRTIETFGSFEQRHIVTFVGSYIGTKPVDITEITNGVQPSEGDYLVRKEDSYDEWLFIRKNAFENKYKKV